MKTFYTRTLTAIIFAAIMLGGILWNEYSFCFLFWIIQAFALREYLLLMQHIHPAYKQITFAHQIFLQLAALGILLLFTGTHFFYAEGNILVLLIFLIFMAAIPLADIFAGKFHWKNWGYSLLGLMYISVSLGLMITLRLNYSPANFPLLPLALIVCIWINDTMAYIVGSLIGRTKFFPSISPKKTWEGTIGGIVLTIIAAGIFGYYNHNYSIINWIIIAALAAIIGTIGDLLESKLKRMAGIKDSGHIMPGHGGFLDRFDSLLLATPFIWLYAAFWL